MLLPKMTLEIRAALDHSLQKEIAALRTFIGSTLDSHTERLQGDVASLMPAARAPNLDLPTVMPERRAWSAIFGWLLAAIGLAGTAGMGWLWWKQGGEIAAVRTDLTAAYAELEILRARPEIVSPPASLEPAADFTADVPADSSAAEPVPVEPGVTSTVTSNGGAPAAAAPVVDSSPLPATAMPAAAMPTPALPAPTTPAQ
jgi:hypothetical protein